MDTQYKNVYLSTAAEYTGPKGLRHVAEWLEMRCIDLSVYAVAYAVRLVRDPAKYAQAIKDVEENNTGPQKAYVDQMTQEREEDAELEAEFGEQSVASPRAEWLAQAKRSAFKAGGNEAVYVYTNAAELAVSKVFGATRVKIGRVTTGSDDIAVVQRIAQQQGSATTGTARQPVILAIVECADAVTLETTIHKVLKLKGKHAADAVGSEWFDLASPVADVEGVVAFLAA